MSFWQHLSSLHDPRARIARFLDLHKGKRCVIVCNGPSLNKMDLSPLQNEIVFGLNKIHLGLNKFGFYPRYLVAVNDKVITQAAPVWREMTCTTFISARSAAILPESPFVFHLKTHERERFSRDITAGLHEGHTVTHATLQIAYFMGIEHVVIVGMDHRYSYSGAPNEALYMSGDDPNHFSPDYFRQAAWDAPNLKESEASYVAAREAFEADGRRITDATLDGACDIFEKMSLERVLA